MEKLTGQVDENKEEMTKNKKKKNKKNKKKKVEQEAAIQISTSAIASIVISDSETDEDGDKLIANFRSTLAKQRSESARRMRPNCSGEWIRSLRSRIKESSVDK